jgi:signal transduction histidine kinase/HAMP domain-containing protein/ActR/RegA family two-component response regulator
MTSFSSLRFRLAGTVFLAVVPASVLMYFANKYCATRYGTQLTWTEFVIGLLALAAAWYGGERFVLRQVRMLSKAAQQLAAGDLTSRTGLSHERGELGDLARTFDTMAASLEERVKERDQAVRTLQNRSFQQTVVAALGQLAMESKDISALVNQTVTFVAQTLEVEYSHVLELQPGGKFLLLRAGVGWKNGCVGKAIIPVDPQTECGFTLAAREAVTFERLPGETRFRGSSLLMDHGVVSGVSVPIVAGQEQAFGILGAHTARRRRFTEDEIHFLFSLATVLAMAVERIRAETELQKLAAFTQLNPNPALELDGDGTVTYCNEAARNLCHSVGHDQPRAMLPPNVHEIVQNCLATGESTLNLQTVFKGRTLFWSFCPVAASRVVHCYGEDITSRLNLEAQLLQSQKMESIGQLAAGIAHDFNNMLTVIQGHSEMLLARTNLPSGFAENAQAIRSAADRAARLTRQLLMFSRKNVMQPQPLDLRTVVGNLSKMLKRLLGETITLEFQPPPELPLVQADTGMIEQVIMNLAVNARDAMPKGGTLKIRTDLVEMNDTSGQIHPEARLGAFVCLRVADTGCGMDAATKSRIFEPFFTTKEAGKGTGLGLATVYGIVKQHEGWVEVSSEVGKGSTFSVFLPASSAPVTGPPPESPLAAATRGGPETILVVEDEPLLRDMAHLILQDYGYHVLEAGSGAEALRVWEGNPGTIDLVLTDMVMPGGISGRDLAGRLLADHPRLKVIFTSGYNVEETNTDFFRRGGAVFLRKPYTRLDLAKAVRDILDKDSRHG